MDTNPTNSTLSANTINPMDEEVWSFGFQGWGQIAPPVVLGPIPEEGLLAAGYVERRPFPSTLEDDWFDFPQYMTVWRHRGKVEYPYAVWLGELDESSIIEFVKSFPELLSLAKEYYPLAMLCIQEHLYHVVDRVLSRNFEASHRHHWLYECKDCNFQQTKGGTHVG